MQLKTKISDKTKESDVKIFRFRLYCEHIIAKLLLEQIMDSSIATVGFLYITNSFTVQLTLNNYGQFCFYAWFCWMYNPTSVPIVSQRVQVRNPKDRQNSIFENLISIVEILMDWIGLFSIPTFAQSETIPKIQTFSELPNNVLVGALFNTFIYFSYEGFMLKILCPALHFEGNVWHVICILLL